MQIKAKENREINKAKYVSSYEYHSQCKHFSSVLKRIGGRWIDAYNPHHKQVDGDKFMCFDTIMRSDSPCLIYSFGIADDWTFEDLMDSLGISNS